LGGGAEAVNCFFIISGFLIAGSWERSGGLGVFLINRFLRIYPGFVVAMVFCVFVIAPFTGAKFPSYLWDARTYLYFKPLILGPVEQLPGVLSSVPWQGVINGSIWTIRFEMLCYMLIALLGLLGLLRRPIVVLLLLAASLAGSQIVLRGWPHAWALDVPWFGTIWELPRFVSAFMAGVAAYVWKERIQYRGLPAVGAILFLVVATVFKFDAIVFPICAAYLVLFVAFSHWIPMQRVGARGDFSYGIYLYAFPIQQLLVYWFPICRYPLVLTAMALPITGILAVGSWKLVEEPCLRLKRRSRSSKDRSMKLDPSVDSAVLGAN
jgi:peptidoglycan/LPS O-acetylase OafA/YrhL